MRKFVVQAFAITMVTLVCSGCISYSTLHTAAPIEEGQTETTLSASFYGAEFDEEAVDIPYTEVAMRYGVDENSDLGFKLFPVGFAFDYNYAVINEDALAVSVNPYLSLTRLSTDSGSVTYGVALANILADVVRGDALSLTLGLKPGWLYAIGSGDGIDTATGGVIGGMVGVKFAMGDSLSVMPNADVITPFEEFADLWFYNFGVAVSF